MNLLEAFDKYGLAWVCIVVLSMAVVILFRMIVKMWSDERDRDDKHAENLRKVIHKSNERIASLESTIGGVLEMMGKMMGGGR